MAQAEHSIGSRAASSRPGTQSQASTRYTPISREDDDEQFRPRRPEDIKRDRVWSREERRRERVEYERKTRQRPRHSDYALRDLYNHTSKPKREQIEMAANKKYAGLPDLDPAPEIYETPELTDDASTVQTSTLRTESPSPSPSEDNHKNGNLDRAGLDREQARRRFESTVVDTRETNLSDVVGGNRKGYKTAHRRRRRRRREDGVEEYGYLSGDSSEEEETLSKKLARLRRETEELRLELAKREQDGEEDEFKDSLEHHQEGGQNEDDREATEGVEELSRVLDGLRTNTRRTKTETPEQEFGRKLTIKATGREKTTRNGGSPADNAPHTAPTSISAIAAFADRLTALETTLGLQSIPTAQTQSTTILPTLNSLSSQITILSQTLTPNLSSQDQTQNLTQISNRLQTLQQESDTLLSTRRAALQTLASLHETRNRASNNSSVFAKYLSRKEARERQRDSLGTTNTGPGDDDSIDPVSTADDTRERPLDVPTIESRVFTDVFLDEQASKITALYNTLPTIQSLQPLLPVVLERLRGLSVIHASAASASNDMEDLERRLADWEGEIAKWRSAVEGMEKGITEAEEVMKENVEVIGGMVRGVESRLDMLKG